MTNRTTLALFLALAAAPGCGVSHAVEPTTDEPMAFFPTPVSPRPIAPITLAPEGSISDCLEGGGELVEVAAVDNNDQHDHGSLLTFGVSPNGVLAAAGEDGTLKFWTLDAELLGSVDGTLLTYGSEIGASPITDVAFMGEVAVVGDVRGLVQQMGADGFFGVLGGTTPDVPIDAVALDADGTRFAHAQRSGEVIPLVVRDMELGEAIDISATLDDIHDLAFAANGDLWVVGATVGGPALEVRAASDARTVTRSIALGSGAPVEELAISADGSIAALVASDALHVVDADGAQSFPLAYGAQSVAVTHDGRFALSVGIDGALVARSTADAHEVARVVIDRPVTVRVDASETLVLVGGGDAIIHAFSCEL